MAIIHRTTMSPGKLELLAAWLPAQPWYHGTGRPPQLARAGGFRLDDPQGEVGIEFIVVTDGPGSGAAAYQVPMTYRAGALPGADGGLIGTAEHGVLGPRWIYDGTQDPVLGAQLAALIQGEAEPQAQRVSHTPDPTVTVQPVTRAALTVAESPDEMSVVFRTYCSQWPLDERRHIRPPVLKPGLGHPGDVVGRHQAALAAGDTEAVVSTFEPDGYFRGPFGPRYTHRGTAELRSFYATCFSAGGGIGLEHCAMTDDGVRCALEYNCIRWGSHDLPPQAGLGVYERGPDGLLAAVRAYDDVVGPIDRR
jgi:hypothetical protein